MHWGCENNFLALHFKDDFRKSTADEEEAFSSVLLPSSVALVGKRL